MEKIYFDTRNNCQLLKAGPRTVALLLAYSKSLEITKIQDIYFESNLN